MTRVMNNVEVELFLKQDLPENSQGYSGSEIENLLSWLSTAPKFVTFRVNTLVTTAHEVCELITRHLIKQAATQRSSLAVFNVTVHPQLPDTVIIGSLDETDLRPQETEIIVDATCGAAVLRGAHVFAPGIMGMPTGVRCGDIVSVFADTVGQCKKGFQKHYTQGSKIFLGNGIVQMERKHLYGKGLRPVGVAIEMTATVSGCPVIGADCLSSNLALLQNLPSILCGHVLRPLQNEIILDMCAAPGNKTTHLAMLLGDQGVVIALDKTESKVNNILKRCQQFSLCSVHAFVYDSTKSVHIMIGPQEQHKSVLQGPPFRPESFDRILLDAPCSALGQRPQLANRITTNQLKSYPRLQRKLFQSAVSLLRPGGTLIYSTCTVTLGENEGLVLWALEHFSNLELIPAVPVLGGPGLKGSGLTEEQRQCVQRFGPPLVDMAVYLDCNATTPVAPTVVQKITDSLNDEWGNPSSCYELGVKSKKSVEEARRHIALMIGGKPEDVIFTSGGTEANNVVIFGIVDYYKEWLNSQSCEEGINQKPHVITTNVEHDAVILPIRHLKKKGEIDVSIVPVSKTGCVIPQDVLSQVRHTTCLITVMLANNETGVIMPVEEIGRCIREVNNQRKREKLIRILYHTDAAQGIGKIKVDAEELKVDYLTIVGHKFYGPRIGCLYARGLGHITPVYPLLRGGGQELGYRPGTENTPMIAGLGEAARLVCDNLSTYSTHMEVIRDYLEEKLKEAFGEDRIAFNCSNDVKRLPNTCNVSLLGEGLVGHVVLSKCSCVMASVGAACHAQNKPSGILLASGVPHHQAVNAIRLSVGRETTTDDIDIAVKDLEQSVTTLSHNKSS